MLVAQTLGIIDCTGATCIAYDPWYQWIVEWLTWASCLFGGC